MKTGQLSRPTVDIPLEDVQDCLVYDRHGVSVPFKDLYTGGKAVIIFVRVGAEESWLLYLKWFCGSITPLESVHLGAAYLFKCYFVCQLAELLVLQL